MQDAGQDRLYVRRYLAERDRLEREATLTIETPDGSWRLYAERMPGSPPEWRNFVAVRSTPPINGSDDAFFRLGHNGRRWQNRRSIHAVLSLYPEMMAGWDLQLRAIIPSSGTMNDGAQD